MEDRCLGLRDGLNVDFRTFAARRNCNSLLGIWIMHKLLIIKSQFFLSMRIRDILNHGWVSEVSAICVD